jgi:hypothetical protein
MSNPYLKSTILEAVDNQIRENNPPIAKETYLRLQAAGYTQQQSKEKIAAVLLADIYDVMKSGQPHDEVNYEKQLRALK